MKYVRAEKLPPEVLDREISRLAAIGGIRFRMKAVSLDAGEYDLTIVDRTAYRPESEEARAMDALASGEGRRLDIETPEGSSGFKAANVAQAVALGRRIASEALRRLGLNPVEINRSRGRVVTKEDIKFHRLPDSDRSRLFSAGREYGGRKSRARSRAVPLLRDMQSMPELRSGLPGRLLPVG